MFGIKDSYRIHIHTNAAQVITIDPNCGHLEIGERNPLDFVVTPDELDQIGRKLDAAPHGQIVLERNGTRHRYPMANILRIDETAEKDLTDATVELWQGGNGELFMRDPDHERGIYYLIGDPASDHPDRAGRFAHEAANLIDGEDHLDLLGEYRYGLHTLTKIATYSAATGRAEYVRNHFDSFDGVIVALKPGRDYVGETQSTTTSQD